METSLEMLELAAAHGTTDIVATPHANSQYAFDAGTVTALARELQSRTTTPVRVHTGCDFHLSYENLQLAYQDPHPFTINGGPYLLVEFNELAIPPNTEQIFDRLLSTGVVPIVTHPERNLPLRKDLDRLEHWVRQGAFLQVTAQSLLGNFGPEAADAAIDMVDFGLVHFVASDAHDTRARVPRLDMAHGWITSRWSGDVADALCRDFPAAVITGHRIEPGPLPRPTSQKRWYEFWR